MLDIRLKERVKKYLRGIWGIEILILVILISFLTINYVKEFNICKTTPGVFNSLFDKEEFIKDNI